MIEIKFLGNAEIERLSDTRRANVSTKLCINGHNIARHSSLVIGPGRLVSDTHAQERQIVQEEGIHVIRAKADEHVQLRFRHTIGYGVIELGNLRIRTFSTHQVGIVRIVWYTKPGNDLRHSQTYLNT